MVVQDVPGGNADPVLPAACMATSVVVGRGPVDGVVRGRRVALHRVSQLHVVRQLRRAHLREQALRQVRTNTFFTAYIYALQR